MAPRSHRTRAGVGAGLGTHARARWVVCGG